MTTANGLRLLLPARKSRKGDEASQFARQEARTAERAERDGHVIVHVTRDVVTSQSMPWERRDLRAWMTDPVKIAAYDAIIVETDRLARCDDKGWHYIEGWCYDNGKRIITAEGVQFPPRDDADRYQWLGLKRRARTYWEDVRDKHAGTRAVIKANGGAIGLPPFGYTTSGEKLRKAFVPHPVNGPLALEAFTRISQGHTATSVAIWLGEQTGKPWRVKRVTDMIGRRSYLGERDGHQYPMLSEDFAKLWERANAALASRSFRHADTGGRRPVHGYSGLVLCECGARYYRHQGARGQEKYRCGRGRRGDFGEVRCEHGAPLFAEANAAVDEAMSRYEVLEIVMVTSGGDHGKQQRLAEITDAMTSAMGRKDMAEVARLAAEFAAADATESEPIRTQGLLTGRTYADVWRDAGLAGRRALLARGLFTVTLVLAGGTVTATIESADKDDFF